MGAVNHVAIRNLALASTVDAKALRLMHLSDRLSRRDGMTEAWLIEKAARRGDLSTTLSHCVALFRTLPTASARVMSKMVRKSVEWGQIVSLRGFIGERL